jgi:mevalonate kinase
MGRGVGYGKVILFGEHFVVHGAPAIAAGIANAAIVEVRKSDRNRIITELKVVEDMSLGGIEGVLRSMGISDKYDVNLSGDLPTYGGLGSSAAFCVGMVRAFAEEKGLSLTNEEVNRHAYEGERTFHGNPSGIDNLMATYGGVMEFRRGKTPSDNKFEKVVVKKPLELVVAFTGKYGPTSKMVEAVRKFKEQDEGEFAQLMDEYLGLEMDGRKSLEKGKMDVVGELMNANQELLGELGVSDELNEKINGIAMAEGAYGAKVTGGGGGGCCIILAKDKANATAIKEKLAKSGFESFITQIAKRG